LRHSLVPMSSLFPYTTLFRSNWVALAVFVVVAVVAGGLARRARRRTEEAVQRGREAAFAAEVSAMLLEPGFVQDKLGVIGSRLGDRKSTRLNSSHGSISYAVF